MLNKEKPVEVIIDKNKCQKCGRCIAVCENYLKQDGEGYPCAKTKDETAFGCIQCGNCMMTCANEAIEVIGQDMDREHLREIKADLPTYEQLDDLYLKRRSIRKFTSDKVSQDDVNKIILSASKAPVSIPPSEVKVLVINNPDKVQELAKDIVSVTETMIKSLKSPSFKIAGNALKIFKPYVYKTLTEYMLPVCSEIVESRKKGEDKLFYNAPAIAIFYGTSLASPADVLIASTYASLASETMGLGTCFIGSLPEIFEKDLKLKHKYGIFRDEKVCSAFILGHPDIIYTKAVQRDFKEVRIEE